MSWVTVRFEDLYLIPSRNGISVGKSDQGGSTKIINMGELFAHDLIGDIETRRVRCELHTLEKNRLLPGDLLFARRSLVAEGAGKCAMVDTVVEETVFESSIIRVRLNQRRCNPRFYNYWFRSPQGKDAIFRLVTGTNVKGIRGSELKEIRVPVPDREEQNRIADVLKAYDDLIDNSRRQIKLLEEAAQRLYREWFVEMRFPGYEDVEFVDGLPAGWTKCRLSDFAEFRRGKVITEKQTKPGTVPVVAGGLTPAYYHNASNAVAPVITVSGSGANAGYTALYGRDIWASDCSFLDSEKTDYIYFVFLTVKVLGRGFKHLQRGSAQPHVYPSHINELEFTCPSCEVLKEFEMLVESIFKNARVLETKIEQLQEARDRLLPKLMSGEIEV